MNVKFTVNKKEFESALNAVTLKGKYKSSHSSKTAVISNDVAGAISDDGTSLTLTNASDTMAAMCSVAITDIQRSGSLSILDKNGKEKAKHRLPFGSKIMLKDNSNVKALDVLAEWDPFTLPVVSQKNGFVVIIVIRITIVMNNVFVLV